MHEALSEIVRRDGAVSGEDPSSVLHFGDPRAELDCALGHVALVDQSSLARLLASGPDFLGLLHRLSTGNVAALEAGGGCETVLTSSKGRIVARLFVHHLGPHGVLAVGGRAEAKAVIEHLGRYTFREETGLRDRTEDTFQFALIGPCAGDAIDGAGLRRLDPYRAETTAIDGMAVHVLGEDGLSPEGRCVVGSAADAPAIWRALADATRGASGRPTGHEVVEAWRILRGLPAAGHELTEEHNPLEAGLWDAVDFDKGCYIGQEVVARLRTYDKVSRSVVGLALPAGAALPPIGAKLFDGDRAVGTVTSAVLPPGRKAPRALGYVKRKAIAPGLELSIGEPGSEAKTVLTELPFAD